MMYFVYWYLIFGVAVLCWYLCSTKNKDKVWQHYVSTVIVSVLLIISWLPMFIAAAIAQFYICRKKGK